MQTDFFFILDLFVVIAQLDAISKISGNEKCAVNTERKHKMCQFYRKIVDFDDFLYF